MLLPLLELTHRQSIETDAGKRFPRGQGDGNFINSTVGIPSSKKLSRRRKY